MQKIVIDTNELIFSVLSSKSYSAEIMKMVYDANISLYINAEILEEYAGVLARDKFGLSCERIAKTLQNIRDVGISFNPTRSIIHIRDEDDRIFYDTAKQSGAILISNDDDLLVLNEDFIMNAEAYIEIMRKIKV